MSTDETKIIAIKYYSMFNGGNLAAIEDLMAPDFTMTIGSVAEPLHGPEGFRQLITMMRSAFPDLHFALKHLIAQDDIAVGHWTSSGTHAGEPFITIRGTLPASGRQFAIKGVSSLRIANGKIVESYVCEDAMGFLQQLGALPSQTEPTRLPSPREQEALIRRYFNEVMNQGMLELIDDLVTPDFAFRIVTRPEPIRGPEGLKQFVTMLRGALPDLHFTLEHQIIEGNTVVARWSNAGTHTGEFLGAAPTNKRITDHGVDIFQIIDGKIAEILVYDHDLQLMRQLGFISVPASA